MELRFKSAVQSFYALMPRAYFLNRSDMEEKEISVPFKGVDHHVCIQVEYKGIDSIITAITGDTRLSFEPNQHGGIDIRQSGEQLEEGLINQIALAIGKALE